MKRLIAAAICILASFGALVGMDFGRELPDVVIYTSMEEFRNDYLRAELKKNFGDLEIDLSYIPSGNSAAKFKAEKSHSAADILMDIEYGHLSSFESSLADLTEFDDGQFLTELIPESRRYFPLSKFGVGILVNREVMKARGLPMPHNYEDLTNSVYRGQISMPSPKASGTAYGFVKGIVNLMGSDAAFAYFDRLNPNILQYTSSGSGPVNNLIRGECAIGIGMIFQGVQAINKGSPIEVLELEEGVAYNISGIGIVKGKETKSSVQRVFDYIANVYMRDDKKYFLPEQIFREFEPTEVKNFPALTYIDMNGIESTAEKERILKLWKY